MIRAVVLSSNDLTFGNVNTNARWISFHDADLPRVEATAGRVVVSVSDASTGVRDSSEESSKCDAVLECLNVTSMVTNDFTSVCEYISSLEYRPEPGAAFRVLSEPGPTKCSEVRVMLWPNAATIAIHCSIATLRLASDSE